MSLFTCKYMPVLDLDCHNEVTVHIVRAVDPDSAHLEFLNWLRRRHACFGGLITVHELVDDGGAGILFPMGAIHTFKVFTALVEDSGL